MNKLLTTIIVLCTFSLLGFAQEKSYRYMVMGVPQHILNNSVRIEIDLAQKNSRKWLTLAPQLYYAGEDSNNNLSTQDYESLKGAGFELLSRTFLTGKNHGEGIYLSWGGGYRFVSIGIDDYIWKPYTENGLNFYRQQQAKLNINTHGLSGRVTAGYQFNLSDIMYADIFVGFGIKYTLYDRPQGSYHTFNQNSLDYGYTGTLFVGGFRLGVAL